MANLERGVTLRIRLLALAFVVAFVLVGWRAFSLQILQKRDWVERAERQHQKSIPLTPQRGTIFDRNGEPMALSMEVDSVYAEPRKLADRDQAARLLAPILDLPQATVRAKLGGDKGFVWLKRQVPPTVSQRVRNLKLDAVGAIKEHQRFYPNSTVGAQVLGFTGLDPKGLAGIEASYDTTLLGRGGYLVMERDALGRGIGSGEPVIEGATRGHDLHLTLDENLQYIVERELAAGVAEFNAKAGAVIVLEPSSGRILAMANQPDYNPNAVSRHKPQDWRNRAISDTFEPGSTLKVFVMAAGLNEGVVTPTQLINCEGGSWKVGGRVIHDSHPHGVLTAEEVLKVSSNIGSAKIGRMLERKRLYGYLREFGFGLKTGLELPGEENGILRDPSRWFEIDLATISFGQGVSVTPLQLAAATGAIANGGALMEPYLVEKITDGEGQVIEERQPKLVRQVVKPEVAARVTRMMETVTAEEGGTGAKARVPGFRVAGKTGTAQKVDPVTGGYSADKRIASFVGFLPADNPRLVVMVMIDEPRGQVYGGLVAAPVFARISTQAMQYLKVPPTEQLSPGETLPTVEEILAQAKKEQEAAAKEAKKAAESESEAAPEEPETVEDVLTADGSAPAAPAGPRMPDFKGMSYRQVIEVMQTSGINVSLRGHGRVIEQSPAPGAAIPYGAPVWVRLAPPGQIEAAGTGGSKG
ncbi:MAG: PASTA domain-containing protein [Deltaproteobacteria bacterium]|nr:MAG: PASTA domain-containing protein [Deltaproteobacteria bacterium]